MPPIRPGKIARYEIRQELGRGMMGVVYEALDPDLDRLIALKTVHPGLEGGGPEGPDFERRFLAEGRAAARLSHPGIVVIHDIGRDAASGALYIALERLSGRTLADVLATEAPLPWERAMTIVASAADALHHAHEQGVVHRDVKPANVMLLSSDAPKIMDFGIAKVDAAQLTAAGQFFGTPLYTSPEQALERPVDRRSDIFSLGAIAYALLTGRHAFAADTVPHVLSRVAYEDPPRPSLRNPAVPDAVDVVVARAMAKDPEHRYADARSFAEDIRELLMSAQHRHATSVSLDEELQDLVGEPSSTAAPGGATWTVAEALGTVVPVARGVERGPVRRGAGLGAVLLIPILAGSGWMARAARVPAEAAGLVPPSAAHLAGGTATTILVGDRPQTDTLVEPAQLDIDLRHGLKNGRLRVWIDDGLLAEEELDSRVRRKVLMVENRRGRFLDSFQIPSGRHAIKVEVAWDDNVRSSRIWGSFRGGSKRRLDARVGGLLRKNLSLDWD